MTRAPESHVRFHAHLDACKQCREHPFNLCVTGQRLIEATAKDDEIDHKHLHYGPRTTHDQHTKRSTPR